MSRRIGLQYPAAFEGGSGVLSEINRALAVIGAAHWMEKYRPSPTRSATKHLDQSAALGHFGWSAPPRLGGRCRIVEATLAGTHRNGRDAPKADSPALALEGEGSLRVIRRLPVTWQRVARRGRASDKPRGRKPRAGMDTTVRRAGAMGI